MKMGVIFGALIDSAETAGNWLIVDRANSKSPAAELLIEMGLAKTTAKPKIVCIDFLKRLKKFTGEKAQKCWDDMDKVLKAGKQIGIAGGGGVVIDQFYQQTDFHDPSGRTFGGGAFAYYADLPLPKPAEALHLINGELPARVKWQYHYLQTFFASGTHYIIVDNDYDAPDLGALGSFGYVCANGQALMFPRLKSLIQRGESTVMLHNTGGVTQAFASIRKAVTQAFPSPDALKILDDVEIVAKAPWKWKFGLPEVLLMMDLQQRAPMLLRTSVVAVDTMEDTSEVVLNTLTCCFAGGGAMPELGLGEAEMICILTAWKRHITLVENARVYERQADALQWLLYALSVATTLITVLYSLAVAEQDAAQAVADASAGARRLAMILAESEGTPVSLVWNMSTAAARMLSEEGDAAAVVASEGEEGETGASAPDGELVYGYSFTMILMPIAASLLGTIRSKLRPREKWASCLMAANQIAGQIYYYRLRANWPGDAAGYDVAAPCNKVVPGSDPPIDIDPLTRGINARNLFVKTCSDIYQSAIASEVSKGGALKIYGMGKMQTHDSTKARNEFMDLLKIHVDTFFYGKRRVKPPRKKKKKKANCCVKVVDVASDTLEDIADAVDDTVNAVGDAIEEIVAEKEADDLGAKRGAGVDDLVSQMPIESYIECRVRPIAKMLEDRAPLLSRRFNGTDMLQMLANSSGAVLAVLGYSNWIAITVAIAGVSGAVQDYFYLPSQLGATNTAMQDMHNLLISFDSMSLVQRKKRTATNMFVQKVEETVLQLCQARTQVSPALPGANEGGDDEE